jgi:hypothetical protein
LNTFDQQFLRLFSQLNVFVDGEAVRNEQFDALRIDIVRDQHSIHLIVRTHLHLQSNETE